MSEETPAEGMTAKKVHFADPSARQAVAVSPEANKMTGGTSAATTPGLEGKGATGTTAAAGTAMDVDNDKKRPASSLVVVSEMVGVVSETLVPVVPVFVLQSTTCRSAALSCRRTSATSTSYG
jgi:hypothetical protein